MLARRHEGQGRVHRRLRPQDRLVVPWLQEMVGRGRNQADPKRKERTVFVADCLASPTILVFPPFGRFIRAGERHRRRIDGPLIPALGNTRSDPAAGRGHQRADLGIAGHRASSPYRWRIREGLCPLVPRLN